MAGNQLTILDNPKEDSVEPLENKDKLKAGPPPDWQAEVSVVLSEENHTDTQNQNIHTDTSDENTQIPAGENPHDKISAIPTDWQADVSVTKNDTINTDAAETQLIIDNPSLSTDSDNQQSDEQKAASPQTDITAHTPVESKIKTKKSQKQKNILPPLSKKIISVEGFVAIGVLLLMFVPIGIVMGFGNLMKTLFANGLDLLLNTCFYLLAVSVIIGAISSVLSEFGTVSIFNKALAPLMKPLYGMPGATSMAIFSSFLSDNPAVLTLASDRKYRRYFKKYQLATLTNIGTSFGMGLIVVVTLLTVSTSNGSAALAIAMGVVGTLIGSVVSTRLMLFKAKRMFGKTEDAEPSGDNTSELYREIREGGIGQRFISSLLDGGSEGVKTGFAIIPGVLIIANLILLLTHGKPAGGYSGGTGQGVALIPFLGEKMSWLFKFLFGFTNDSAISIPLTSLGSAGAAIGIITKEGATVYTANELAVFTAMCMFWSGYLSTHVAMMDGMGFRKLTGWSILFHTIAGLVAGICANYLYQLCALLL